MFHSFKVLWDHRKMLWATTLADIQSRYAGSVLGMFWLVIYPILMLTARSELDDRVTGLNAGADYYLTKPFDTRELLACVNALLRRQGVHVDVLSFGNTVLDLASATLVCGAERIRLSSREFEIMRLLLRAEGNNISKETILTKVWGYDSDAVENHVEVYIGFLRKKLANIGSNVRIEAIRRLGYHLEVCVHA